MLVFDFFAFLVAAFCFGFVAFTQRSLLALGLFAWVLVPLVHTAVTLF